MANTNLSAAKSAKNDEFYTQYADIQKEVNAYLEYDPNVFRDKTILLPCDDPEWSNFTKFFAQNFERFGLKKLISTSYAIESKNAAAGSSNPPYRGVVGSRVPRDRTPHGLYYQPTLFETESPAYDETKTRVKGKIFVLDHDTNANGRIDIEDLEWKYLEGDGDFRSDEVKKLRDEADIIVTNPPFSLFREFLAWIVGDDISRGEHGERGESSTTDFTDYTDCVNGRARAPAAPSGRAVAHTLARPSGSPSANVPSELRSSVHPRPPKKFLIIGNMNALKYKEAFPLIQSDRMWLGATGFSTDMVFAVPKGTIVPAAYKEKAERMGYVGDYTRLGNSCWYTNLDHGRRHQPLSLMTERDNIKYSKHKEVKGIGYAHYVNYDAIEVPYTDAIPSDYQGVMGVPISFFDKYCPEQFEIIGTSPQLAHPIVDFVEEDAEYEKGGPACYLKIGEKKYRRLYDRIFIRFRNSCNP